MRASLTLRPSSESQNVVLDTSGVALPRSRIIPGVQIQSGSILSSSDSYLDNDIENSGQTKNQAQDEKSIELKRNISNYNNMLEQNIFLEPNSATSFLSESSADSQGIIDTSAASNILMTNLSQPDEAEENTTDLKDAENNKSCKEKNVSQKSILGGRVLKLTELPTDNLNVDYNEDYRTGLVTFDPNLITSSTGASILSEDVSKPARKIPSNPYRVLDAPGLQDDFYLNLVDWSAQNILAVALES